MTRVYLTEQGSTAHSRGGRLLVEKAGEPLLRLPLERVEQIVVVGKGIQLSTALLVELLARGVEVAYLSRSGRYYGKVSGAPGGGAPLRAAQYACLSSRAGALNFAQVLVSQKLAGQAEHLSARGETRTAVARIKELAQRALQARDVDQARGYEGAGAAAYWQALVPLMPSAWGFVGRRHYPAPDPLNALLSFAYTLLLQEIVADIHLVGLDAQFGALHPPEATRPSLALDLEEPLRPLGVDSWVFAAALGGAFRPDYFHREGERVLLDPAGRRVFFTLYERELNRPAVHHPLASGRISLRQALQMHVRLAGRFFSGAAVLEPPRWR